MGKLKEFEASLRFLTCTAKKPLIWLETFDYNYVIETLKKVVPNEGRDSIAIWNVSMKHVTNLEGKILTSKLTSLGHFIPQYYRGKIDSPRENAESNELQNVDILVAKVTESMFKDDGDKIEERLVARLQEFVYKNNIIKEPKDKKTILIISTYHFEVNGLEHLYERLNMPLPDVDDIRDELCLNDNDFGIGGNGLGKKTKEFEFSTSFKINLKENTNRLVDALNGMYLYDIKNLLKTIMSEAKYKKISPFDYNYGFLTDRVIEGKKQIVKNSGLLEVIEIKGKNYHEHVADIDNLRSHLIREKELIKNDFFLQSNLPRPKGILLVGAPGCGKSESAKAVSSILGLPLFRLNIGDLLGHKYGQSENRFNEALRTADASAPCVLWIDEIEKAFAGAGNEQGNDDTLTHIIGRFLTWMQEHETLVYLVATANHLSKMRPELLRKGRWDEIYYLTYPSIKGRYEIIKKCFSRYDITLKDDNDNDLLKITSRSKTIETSGSCIIELLRKMNGWSGAEICSLVVDSIKDAFRRKNSNGVSFIRIEELNNKIKQSTLDKEDEQKKNRMLEEAIETKILTDIREMQIKSFRKFDSSQIDDIKELLRDKYINESTDSKQQYSYARYEQEGYKPASKNVHVNEENLKDSELLSYIFENNTTNN